MYSTLAVEKGKPKRNSGLNGKGSLNNEHVEDEPEEELEEEYQKLLAYYRSRYQKMTRRKRKKKKKVGTARRNIHKKSSLFI